MRPWEHGPTSQLALPTKKGSGSAGPGQGPGSRNSCTAPTAAKGLVSKWRHLDLLPPYGPRGFQLLRFAVLVHNAHSHIHGHGARVSVAGLPEDPSREQPGNAGSDTQPCREAKRSQQKRDSASHHEAAAAPLKANTSQRQEHGRQRAPSRIPGRSALPASWGCRSCGSAPEDPTFAHLSLRNATSRQFSSRQSMMVKAPASESELGSTPGPAVVSVTLGLGLCAGHKDLGLR